MLAEVDGYRERKAETGSEKNWKREDQETYSPMARS
jgi:hypothetical protein